jgi:hypothetical protein
VKAKTASPKFFRFALAGRTKSQRGNHGKKNGAGGIVFSRYSNQHGFTDFPAPVGPVEAAATAFAVLSCLEPKDWPPEPGIDGDVHRGWRVKQDFGQVEVEPFWMIYHEWQERPDGRKEKDDAKI